MEAHSSEVFVIGLTVFFLACIIGYYVVWSVTPALHSPLMGVTNAISSVIIVGASLAAGPFGHDTSKIFGIIGVVLASINIFGGFIVTYRMLSMFKKKPKKDKKDEINVSKYGCSFVSYFSINVYICSKRFVTS